MRFLFLHGGPGMNSFAERAIVGPLFDIRGHDAYFWNEPSRLRPAGDAFHAVDAFVQWFASAERAVVAFSAPGSLLLIAHSWAAVPAIEIARRHPDRVAGLVLVAPTTDLFAAFSRALRLAQQDLAADQPQIAAGIAACLARTRSLGDDSLREGLRLAFHDPKLFTHYWADPVQFEASVAAMSCPEAQFDAESFFAVLDDFDERWTSLRSEAPLTMPALVVWGARDLITPFAETRAGVLAEIPHATVEVFDDGGHFVHLDRPRRFIDTLFAWAHDQLDVGPGGLDQR